MNKIEVIDASEGLPKKETIDFTWWTQPKEKLHESLFACVRDIENRQSSNKKETLKFYKYYHDSKTVDMYANMNAIRQEKAPNRMSLNVIKAVVDTLSAKIAKSRPRAMFLTEGGNFQTQQLAKKLTKFVDGCFEETNHYAVKQQTFIDSLISGNGVTKFYIDDEGQKIKSERIFPSEVLVDELDAMYGKPRSLYHIRYVNKDILKNMFSIEFENQINDADGPSISVVKGIGSTANMAEIVEAWHLPSGKDAKDGRHCISISNTFLVDEVWSYDWFPFTFEQFTKPALGFWATGLVKDLIPIQLEINNIIKRIQESIHLIAVPRIFVESSSKINKAALDNDIGSIVEYQGQPPIFHVAQALNPEVYNYLWSLYQKAFEISGVSQLSATSQKPAGLNAAVAMREYQDIESERFHLIAQNREDSFLESSEMFVRLAKILSQKDSKWKVRLSGGRNFETIKFKELDLDESKYFLKTYPTAFLPQLPAAKTQKVIEYMQAGLFDLETAKELLDFPDIEAVSTMQLSPRRVIIMQLEDMLETGVYTPPEPFFPIDQCVQLGQLFYTKCKIQKVPEERLELVRTYIDQAQTMSAMVQQTEQQLAQAQAMMAQVQQMPDQQALQPQALNQ